MYAYDVDSVSVAHSVLRNAHTATNTLSTSYAVFYWRANNAQGDSSVVLRNNVLENGTYGLTVYNVYPKPGVVVEGTRFVNQSWR